MTDATTRVTIRFATQEFIASIDDRGLITVTNRGISIIDKPNPQAGKAIIAAVYELQDLQLPLLEASLALRAAGTQRLFSADELPLSVDIEGGKYTYRCHQAGAFNVVNQHIDRNGGPWIDADELQYKAFWFALAGALHNTRRKLALLENTASTH